MRKLTYFAPIRLCLRKKYHLFALSEQIFCIFAFEIEFQTREQAAPQHRASSLHSVCAVLAV